mmetsp:Transcript_10471/g.26231  ORF Transcript_10471/g.26231 Transcript_10471/m.26231 type:complete len:157 (-) Transcript_10471:258-728(-)
MYGGGFYSSKKSPSSLLGTTRMGKQTLDTMEVGIILTTSLQNCICSFVLLEGIIKTEDFLDGLLGPRVLELRKAHDLVPVVPQDCNVVATCCCPFCWEASKEDLPPFLPLWRIVPECSQVEITHISDHRHHRQSQLCLFLAFFHHSSLSIALFLDN